MVPHAVEVSLEGWRGRDAKDDGRESKSGEEGEGDWRSHSGPAGMVRDRRGQDDGARETKLPEAKDGYKHRKENGVVWWSIDL